jgi:hypothetical protein
MLMSYFAALPETGNLFLLGSLLIVAGLVLRRLRSMIQAPADSRESLETRRSTLELPQEKGLSQPVSPQL